MRPARQREHDLEGPKRENEASAAAAALLGRTEDASAAAGTRFGTTGGAEMGPALQREQHFEGPEAIEFETHTENCNFENICIFLKSTRRGPEILRTESGERGE